MAAPNLPGDVAFFRIANRADSEPGYFSCRTDRDLPSPIEGMQTEASGNSGCRLGCSVKVGAVDFELFLTNQRRQTFGRGLRITRNQLRRGRWTTARLA